MPAGVRVQQWTPVVRPSTNQPTTIVRFMSPGTTTATIRPTSGQQQQIIQLNTTKQQNQPLVIKAITTQASNRQQQQQPIFLTATAQQKTILTQGQQQVLVLNQNPLQTVTGQQPKFTLQMTSTETGNTTVTTDPKRQETSSDPGMPQLDGTVDDTIDSSG